MHRSVLKRTADASKVSLFAMALFLGGQSSFATPVTTHLKPFVNIEIEDLQRTITGRVLSVSTQRPIAGVTIKVKGTDKATQSDESGRFSIDAEVGDVLEASYLGFQTTEHPISSAANNTILLSSVEEALDEVVVMGYGTQRKGEVTSAVSSVKEKDFNQGGMRNPLELVQGKVAGLNITRAQGGNPNSSTNVQLRGMSSMRGDNSPLIVIDGIPGGSLDLIKQGDIESIDVLKDGSAAAIYGTRGNGGVILVTTKKGKAGTREFEYQNYLQKDYIAKKPDFLTADQFRNYIQEGVINAEDYGSSTDMYDELINHDNVSHFHNFIASGGSENSTYRASINYQDAQGIAKENGREQFGGRLNIMQTGLENRLTLTANIVGNFNRANLLGGKSDDNKNVPDFEQAIQRNPTGPIFNEDGSYFETQGYNNFNPLGRLANRLDERDQQTFSGDARLKLQVLDELSVSAFGSYVRDTWNDRAHRSTEDWDQRPQSEYQGMAYAFKRNELNWHKTFETTIDYNKTFNQNHNLTGLLGYSYQYYTYERFDMSNNGFTTDAFYDWNMGAGTAITNDKLPRPSMGSFKEDNTLIAFFGRINYNYADKYFVSAILRREGSSRFGANNKWGNFPAISAGWTLTNEEFFQVEAINNLRVRLGYGVTGNQGFPNYRSLTLLSTGGVYPQNGIFFQTYGPSSNPNPDLKWEQKAETNFGIDFGILGNRISGSLDLYSRKTKDLLYEYKAQQPAYARENIWYNVGEISNKGIELFVSAEIMRKNDFSWSMDLAANYQQYKLTKLSSDQFKNNWLEYGGLPSPGNLGNAIRLEEGGEIGQFYGKRFAGFTDDGKWLFYKADGSTGTSAEMSSEDLTYIGNGVPKYNASLTQRFNYKGFDLTLFFRGKFKFDILNTPDLYFGNKKWLPNNVLSSAFGKHDMINDDPQYSDYYLENGSFVKLDNITLGYNIKTNTPYLRNLYVYLSGRNIATFTGYSGLDPEIQDAGFEPGIDWRGFYPRTKSWSLGVQVGF